MLFITHALPKTLQVDEIVQIGAARPPPNISDLDGEMVGASATA